jgi:hypothetical protein
MLDYVGVEAYSDEAGAGCLVDLNELRDHIQVRWGVVGVERTAAIVTIPVSQWTEARHTEPILSQLPVAAANARISGQLSIAVSAVTPLPRLRTAREQPVCLLA